MLMSSLPSYPDPCTPTLVHQPLYPDPCTLTLRHRLLCQRIVSLADHQSYGDYPYHFHHIQCSLYYWQTSSISCFALLQVATPAPPGFSCRSRSRSQRGVGEKGAGGGWGQSVAEANNDKMYETCSKRMYTSGLLASFYCARLVASPHQPCPHIAPQEKTHTVPLLPPPPLCPPNTMYTCQTYTEIPGACFSLQESRKYLSRTTSPGKGILWKRPSCGSMKDVITCSTLETSMDHQITLLVTPYLTASQVILRFYTSHCK